MSALPEIKYFIKVGPNVFGDFYISALENDWSIVIKDKLRYESFLRSNKIFNFVVVTAIKQLPKCDVVKIEKGEDKGLYLISSYLSKSVIMNEGFRRGGYDTNSLMIPSGDDKYSFCYKYDASSFNLNMSRNQAVSKFNDIFTANDKEGIIQFLYYLSGIDTFNENERENWRSKVSLLTWEVLDSSSFVDYFISPLPFEECEKIIKSINVTRPVSFFEVVWCIIHPDGEYDISCELAMHYLDDCMRPDFLTSSEEKKKEHLSKEEDQRRRVKQLERENAKKLELKNASQQKRLNVRETKHKRKYGKRFLLLVLVIASVIIIFPEASKDFQTWWSQTELIETEREDSENIHFESEENIEVEKATQVVDIADSPIDEINNFSELKDMDTEETKIAFAQDRVAGSTKYALQVALLKSDYEALALQEEYISKRIRVKVQIINGMYAVLIGNYSSLKSAKAAKAYVDKICNCNTEIIEKTE